MKWSFRIGRWWGVEVYLHTTFLLLLAWVGMSDAARFGSVTGGLVSVLLYACLFGCVLLHEFGHAMAALHYGIPTRDITLLPIGGVARLERIPSNPRQELVIAVAGPLVNVVLGAALAVFLYLSHQSLLPDWRSGWFGFAQRLLMVNVSLVAFNLLPAFPMDGGRMLRAGLAMAMDPVKATRIAAFIGRGMAILFAGFALYSGNYLLLFIALFVWMGAGGEARAAEVRAATGGARAGDSMRTQFVTLNASDTIATALRHASGGSQTGFPVVEDGRLVGIALRSDLQESAASLGDATAVGRIARNRLVVVTASEPLSMVVPRIRASGIPVALVTDNGRLVGLLELDDLA